MTIYHEFIDGENIPRILVIPTDIIDWNKLVFQYPLPIVKGSEDMKDIDELDVNVTVFSDELIRVPNEAYFGIDIYRITNRIMEQGVDPQGINNLIIRLIDLDELFEMTY